jgi:hypothetical protein
MRAFLAPFGLIYFHHSRVEGATTTYMAFTAHKPLLAVAFPSPLWGGIKGGGIPALTHTHPQLILRDCSQMLSNGARDR